MYNESAKKAVAKYKKANIKRIPLEMQITYYAKLKEAADKAGEPMNSYIKGAIQMRMDAENEE